MTTASVPTAVGHRPARAAIQWGRHWPPLVFAVAVLLLWWASTTAGLLPRYLVPSPADTWEAFTKNAPYFGEHTLVTLIETVLVLYLRRILLLRQSSSVRAFVGRDEIEDQLRSYRAADVSDQRGFDRRVEAAINKMKRYSVLLGVSGDDDRWEISPVLALVVGADQVAAITDELERLRSAPEDDQ